MAGLPIFLAALLAASPAQAAAPAYEPAQARTLLDAFKAACDRTGELATMKADALAAGWQEIAEDSDPRVAKLAAAGRKASEGVNLSGAFFRRSIGGREIFLVQSRVSEGEGAWGAGCRVYDFGGFARLEAQGIDQWMGMPPTGSGEPAPGLSSRLWEPGWRSGITVEFAYIPPGHPLGEAFGLRGNILVVQAIGGF